MKITIDPEILQKIPNARLGILKSKVSTEESQEDLLKMLHQCIEKEARKDFTEIREIACINEARDGYKKLGKDPNRYRPSADSLHRRITKERGLYTINNVVELINIFSIKSGFSIGGYDASKISGDIVFRTGKSGEPYRGIGRGDLNIEHMPLLADDLGAFGSPTSDSERTSVTKETTELLIVVFDFGANDCLDSFMQEFGDALKRYADGREVEIGHFDSAQ